MRTKFTVLMIFLLTLSFSANAVDKEVETSIKRSLANLLPDIEVTSISATPVPDIYQVILATEYVYMTADGKYFFQGELIDVANRENLTETERNTTREQAIENLDEKELIVFPAKNETNSIYVFTDIDCGYCRKLHEDVPALNAAGISVKYLAYPRAGEGSLTWNEMAEVWCATDKGKAMTDAKRGSRGDLGKGNSVEQLQACNQLVEDQYFLGQTMGVRGTPAIYLENGYPVKGYLPPERLVEVVSARGL